MIEHKGTPTSVLGVITGIIQPKAGPVPTTPGKILIKSETSGDDCAVTVWQLFKDKKRTIEMDPLWDKIHPEWSLNKRIMIGCQFHSDFVKDSGEVIHQYDKMVSLEYLGGGTPPEKVAPSVAPDASIFGDISTTVAPTQPPQQMTFEEKKRHDIAWLGAINLAVPLVRPPVEALPEEIGSEARQVMLDSWVMRYEELAWPIYLSKMKQPVKPVELTPEQELFPQQELFQGLTGEV